VHYNVFDGNTSDDQTHIPVWTALCEIAGRSDFLYVADSKLCTRQNMAHIVSRGGHFLTVLPATRREEARFRLRLTREPLRWEPLWTRPPTRRRSDPPEQFEAYQDAPSAEGYRLVWFRSSEKWKRDEQSRQNAIDQARFALQQLRERVGRYRLKTRHQVEQAVAHILEEYRATGWIKVEVIERQRHHVKQLGPGRPGPLTTYARQTTTVFEPVDTVDAAAVQACAAADGIFPLLTDLPPERLSALEMLQIYKYQAFVEKRHEQLKTAAEVVPVNFKNPERIEAYLFLYFLALTLHGLIERQVRRAMKQRRLRSIALYPEQRQCRAPTADKILGAFEPLRAYRLTRNRVTVRNFADPLSDLHRLLLSLLNTSEKAYAVSKQ
jgi:transposase